MKLNDEIFQGILDDLETILKNILLGVIMLICASIFLKAKPIVAKKPASVRMTFVTCNNTGASTRTNLFRMMIGAILL